MWEVKHINEYGEERVAGIVDGHEILVLGNHTNRPGTVMSCICLNGEIEAAKEYLECMNATFKKYDEVCA